MRQRNVSGRRSTQNELRDYFVRYGASEAAAMCLMLATAQPPGRPGSVRRRSLRGWLVDCGCSLSMLAISVRFG
jgi:hypothetical protein